MKLKASAIRGGKFIAPFVLGALFYAIFSSFFSPLITNWIEPTEISYVRDDSVMILDSNTVSNINLEINGAKVTELYGQVVQIWNSGKKPINNLHITYYFDGEDEDFRIYDIIHNVSPQHEIYATRFERSSDYWRYSYDSIEPNEYFTVLSLTNKNIPIKLAMKGISPSNIKEIKPREDKPEIWWSWIWPGFVTFILTLFGIFLLNKRKWISISARKSSNLYNDLRSRWHNYCKYLEDEKF